MDQRASTVDTGGGDHGYYWTGGDHEPGIRVSGIRDTRLVSVPTLGRVIPMTGTVTSPQVKMVLQQEHVMEESEDMLIRPPPLIMEETVSSNTGLINKMFPAPLLTSLLEEFKQCGGDAVWECAGARFRVHRLVLASVSPLMRECLLEQCDQDSRPVINTPELSDLCVKSLLCLFYTGKVNIPGIIMNEVNAALQMLMFQGEKVSLVPSESEIKHELTQAAADHEDESDDDWEPRTDQAYDDDILGEEEEDTDWWQPSNKKRRTSKSRDKDQPAKQSYPGFRRGRKSLKTPDTDEVYRTRGPGKAERSYQLSLELFDGRAVDFIHVCHVCYQVFERAKEFSVHKDDEHPGESRGPYHTTDKHEYHCPKCDQIIRVKHVAWFSKHLKYCRVDNNLANTLLTPEDAETDNDDDDNRVVKRKHGKRTESTESSVKDSDERMRITGEGKGKNAQSCSMVLFGKIVDYIWGCRLCYSVFLSEDSLETHKELEHGEEDGAGEHWNSDTESYTCPHCRQRQNSRHLVWFIYHMKKCSMNNIPQSCVKREVNDTEDDTDTETDPGEIFDPDQILLKPYKIFNDRAKWICRSLINKLVSTLYPCHVCYQVYETEDSLRDHFRTMHKGLANIVTNGNCFDPDNNCFICPSCSMAVCKNQASSIKFIYHYRKCSKKAFIVKEVCDECGEEFTQFKQLRNHKLQHVNSFMCHLCTKSFPSNARLNYHVQYVHSAVKPYSCDQCEKSYKRKAELQEHTEMSHSSHFNYSCEKCGKQFYGKKNLALHMKTHYTNEEKKHVCNICGHRFAKIKFLKNHMTVHSDVRKYACEVCGARVKTRDTLKQHRKKLHNLLTPVPKNATVVVDEVTRTTPVIMSTTSIQQQQNQVYIQP